MKKKILILKLEARGDVLRTTSILAGLKEKYPRSEIWWVTKEESVPLLKYNELIDRIFVFSNELIKKFKRERFEVILNLNDDYDTAILATKLKGKVFGYYVEGEGVVPTVSAKEWFDMSALGEKPKNDVLKKKNKRTHQKHMQNIAEIKPKYYDIVLDLTKRQRRFAEIFKRRFNLSQTDLIIGLNTGGEGRWPKEWSVDNTSKLAEMLHKKLNAKIILFGGPNEIERNNKIVSTAKVPIINVGCGNNLFEFPALMSICDLVITTDTLGLHIALGLKRKVVALFGPTSANEIEMYGLGVKLKPKKECKCFYQNKCTQKVRCIDTISLNEVFDNVGKLLNKRVCVVVSSFREPNLKRALEALKSQRGEVNFDIVVSAADKESERVAKKFKGVKVIQDAGKGKSAALNILFKRLKYDIMLFTDADVVLDENAVDNMVNAFKNPLIGCVCGRPVAMDNRSSKFGYWAHFLYDVGAHEISRKRRYERGDFLECSGYLFGFRKGVVDEIPLDVAEDSYIPYIFWKHKYEIGYAENAKVFVKNPENLKDWLRQRVRTAKAHETLTEYAPDFPRVKSFFGEVKGAITNLMKIFTYPRNLKEFFWTLELFPVRLFLWLRVFWEIRFKKKHYGDAWERVESTKLTRL
ncbi:MAG: glycosyltransferase [Nanoarchaeota archaeon]|nr:glycosyltransferase [Nanoarchaeota archaeon]